MAKKRSKESRWLQGASGFGDWNGSGRPFEKSSEKRGKRGARRGGTRS